MLCLLCLDMLPLLAAVPGIWFIANSRTCCRSAGCRLASFRKNGGSLVPSDGTWASTAVGGALLPCAAGHWMGSFRKNALLIPARQRPSEEVFSPPGPPGHHLASFRKNGIRPSGSGCRVMAPEPASRSWRAFRLRAVLLYYYYILAVKVYLVAQMLDCA